MHDTIFVRPARDANGVSQLIPRAPKVLLRQPKNGQWPEGAILAEGEELERTPYIRDLIRRRDLIAEPTPIKASASRRDSAPKPKSPTEPEKSTGAKPVEK